MLNRLLRLSGTLRLRLVRFRGYAVIFHRLGLVDGEFFYHLVVNLLVLLDMAAVVNHSVVELAGRDVVLLEDIAVGALDSVTVTVDTSAGESQISIGKMNIDKHIGQAVLLNFGTRTLTAVARLRHHKYH